MIDSPDPWKLDVAQFYAPAGDLSGEGAADTDRFYMAYNRLTRFGRARVGSTLDTSFEKEFLYMTLRFSGREPLFTFTGCVAKDDTVPDTENTRKDSVALHMGGVPKGQSSLDSMIDRMKRLRRKMIGYRVADADFFKDYQGVPEIPDSRFEIQGKGHVSGEKEGLDSFEGEFRIVEGSGRDEFAGIGGNGRIKFVMHQEVSLSEVAHNPDEFWPEKFELGSGGCVFDFMDSVGRRLI